MTDNRDKARSFLSFVCNNIKAYSAGPMYQENVQRLSDEFSLERESERSRILSLIEAESSSHPAPAIHAFCEKLAEKIRGDKYAV